MDEKELKKTTIKRNLLITLIDRELKLMNREPVYFINGPMVIFLLPIIMGASLFFQNNSILFDIKKLMNHPDFSYYLNLISIGIIVFLGASTSIAATCISREGRAFEFIKSLPINPKLYITAKIIHGLIFGILAAAIILIMDLAFFKIDTISLLIILITSIIILTMIFILEVFAELKWPKLNWDNPQKAIKQNINGVVGIFGTMGIVGLFGALIVKFNIKSNGLFIALIVIPLIISVILYQKLLSYADKRFYEIEI
ncbi:ABC transporter permease [Caloramator sp. Dgby_cultured_2]|uniref:ABC transporter permease n=1 Tax=Caloramator sp. Dgby_cultured_2 TaxID=3029174 RepID=UPI00237EE272|nr:ABC transporter permease [Caloramator sp. Dgby_cultured_2]WDU83404.1 ABC transporter permease [Caloramator sp. Dgby_cultured_2]